MVSSSVFITSVLAATTAALPHLPRDGPPTATKTSTSTSSTASSTSTSGGGVQIVNNMDTTVYLWTTSSNSGDMQTLNSGGGTYSESWATNSDGGGISIKMSTSTNEDSVLQFEYTEDGETLFWDLSCIDLDSDSEFISSGFSVTPEDSSCSSASCAAGDTDCADAYQESDDDDTNSCSSSVGYTLTLG
ncbi:uncharacterized protein N7459_000902 [Penicillium hispanicum]|uniref:uncharacterized protein n=1 Tax=Penicillium hispanicum TaxID=1080232 RepID=UPI002542530E|nr:uncharacterized protein N7459_000902 [Penicillium hispanicum]KAJ5594694.1 hypothetical protein N7459_000902 [Penicillium hispanicum]